MQNIDIPHICFAMYYTPHSLKDVCDCKIFCKYNPKSKLCNSNKNYS